MMSTRERERMERLVRAVAQDRREVLNALDAIETAALDSLNVKRRIAEEPGKWLLFAIGVGLLCGLRGGARRN
jgi:hypothetical protein